MTVPGDDPEYAGSIPVGAGIGAVVRIPLPGSNGLAIELKPRGFVPKSGSTSTLFVQDTTGKRHLRLDYGYNKTTKTIDYHWNQQGVHREFGIRNHQPAGRLGRGLYRGARYYKYAGRTLLVFGAVIDGYSIVVASRPLQRATEVVSAWAGAWAGCKVVGAGGAAGGGSVGSAVPVIGNAAGAAVGGIAGCIIGGIGGYMGGEAVGRSVFMWAEGTVFSPVPQVTGPTR